MRHSAILIPLILAAAAPARAEPLPVGETTYIERSLNRDGPLVIEHRPVARTPGGRRAGSSAEIAGFCRDGGHVRRRDEFGRPVIIRQREVCDSVAPRTLAPGEVDPRPTWPEQAVPVQRVLRSRG
ncbi:hypothetical protein ASG40_14530 [Methylobacterium sp. Leaf399]|uniref:hypothetical protein n=1 Tax=unclassified Methylobacterium TaxID=2615210 RepID=UPI0006F787E4|nr:MULTISPECIES: hypothetical protein [unclassified Methylobacterium]KQP50213.1 hypothetical protein ASF39_12875 [Methylobacterium sp. Leaf108]KQT07215.1 hypothetical protein ASG40_14530 [Methylobacterium sp. Leaf399]KQT76945.1 hypothetical protein ASG59_13410 [Methylobacterium sp. Leaf466]